MGITNTQSVKGATQPDGRFRLRHHFTHSETGKTTVDDRNLVPSDFDVVADAAARLPVVEQQVKDQELRRIENDIINGAAYPAIRDAAIFNTADEVDTFLMKRTANRLRPVNSQTIESDLNAVVQMEAVFDEASGPNIATLLGISTPEGNSFKGKVLGLAGEVNGYDTEFLPLYPEVED